MPTSKRGQVPWNKKVLIENEAMILKDNSLNNYKYLEEVEQ
jgi:hypothetical protein